jgi:hypothetical protein
MVLDDTEVPEQRLGHPRLLGHGSLRYGRCVFGCWYARVTKERVRQQAFEEWAREGERLERERRARESRW